MRDLESLFKSQGIKNPAPRIQMLDGVNEGWIDFEAKGVGPRKGKVARETVLRVLNARMERKCSPAPLEFSPALRIYYDVATVSVSRKIANQVRSGTRWEVGRLRGLERVVV